MTTTLDPITIDQATPEPVAVEDGSPDRDRPGSTGRGHRWLTGAPSDPRWVRPALISLLAGTAVLYLWVWGRAAGPTPSMPRPSRPEPRSWKAFFFGSFDSSSFITVDKPPAALWVMEISARIFGLTRGVSSSPRPSKAWPPWASSMPR